MSMNIDYVLFESNLDDLYDKFRIELDRKIMEEQRKEEESRRAVCTATKNFNKIQVN